MGGRGSARGRFLPPAPRRLMTYRLRSHFDDARMRASFYFTRRGMVLRRIHRI